MKFKLEFDCGNAAFEGDGLRCEVPAIIREVAALTRGGAREGIVRDVNGNKIGQWGFSDE